MTDLAKIIKIIKKYYEQLYIHKSDNLNEMDKSLERQELPKWTQEETEYLNRHLKRY